jgi:hypothetical protein
MTNLLEEAINKVKKLPPLQQENIARIILKELDNKNDSFWQEFDLILEDCQMQTDINDLSYQHDHYLYGKPKQILE